jgi:molybdenum cofactor biosynthesis enzyme MoaA
MWIIVIAIVLVIYVIYQYREFTLPERIAKEEAKYEEESRIKRENYTQKEHEENLNLIKEYGDNACDHCKNLKYSETDWRIIFCLYDGRSNREGDVLYPYCPNYDVVLKKQKKREAEYKAFQEKHRMERRPLLQDDFAIKCFHKLYKDCSPREKSYIDKHID